MIASLARLAAIAIAMLCLVPGSASADWTTYHGDAARSGVDSSSAGSLPFGSAWTSPTLGGDVYAEPLVYRGLVVVATESNDVYGLSEATGAVVWHVNAGAAVPAAALPCGDITPTVGITSTPVIDPASGTLYVVADVWDGSHAHHVLVAYNVGSGLELWRTGVDPAGSTPENQLQRAALNLSGGRVQIGFGGNFGDCGSYWGWLVSVSESDHSSSVWKAPTGDGDAIWAPGGPVVDGAGNVYAATGNGSSTTTFDYGESVVKFDASAHLLDYFAPSTWASDNANDRDLGSASPELLANSLIYQNGKNGTGYLLSAASLGHIGGQLYSAPVCNSFGADAYQNGVIYVACSSGSGGIRALSLDTTNNRFSPLWTGPTTFPTPDGPPIIAGGLVWVTAWGAGTLYGLDPATGHTVVYQSTPAMEHFTTPSASDGKLFLATGQTIQAYTIANPGSPPPPPPPPPPPSTSGSGGSTSQPASSTPSSTPQLPQTCGCTGGRCRILLGLAIPRHTSVIRARVYLDRKLIAARRGYRLMRISFPSPAHRRSFSIRLAETTSAHRRLTYLVKYRDCRRILRRRIAP